MFDNPFDSFHNSVAEAKEEREQLDRLLTISTPRERLLVIVISIVIVLFGAWLFFGQISQSLSLPGVLIHPLEGNQENNRTVQTTNWIHRDNLALLKVGLAATVEVQLPTGGSTTYDGEVASIQPIGKTDLLTTTLTTASMSLQRITIVLAQDIGDIAEPSQKYRVKIDLPSRSPISLFGIR